MASQPVGSQCKRRTRARGHVLGCPCAAAAVHCCAEPIASSLGQAGKRIPKGYLRGNACTRARAPFKHSRPALLKRRFPAALGVPSVGHQAGVSSLSAHPYKAHQGTKCRYAPPQAPKRNQAALC